MTVYYDTEKYQRTWRPVSIADSNRYSVSWSRRIEAQDRLDEVTFQQQIAAASCALGRPAKEKELKVAPQRAPLYTQYPAFPAARACIGLTAIAEYVAQLGASAKWLNILNQTRQQVAANIDPAALDRTRGYVLEAVSNRVCLDHLSRFAGVSAVESYRLFAAAMLDLRFRQLRDLILAACLLGDLLFALLSRERIRNRLHPLSVRILEAMSPAIARYQAAVRECDASQLPVHAVSLATQLFDALLRFLPLKLPETPKAPTLPAPVKGIRPAATRVPVRKQQVPPMGEDVLSLPLQGTDEVVPPAIDEPAALQTRPKAQSQPSDRLPPRGPSSTEELQVQAALQQAVAVLAQATGKESWQDPRVDQVAQSLRRGLFKPGVIERELTAKQRKVKAFGSEREGTIREEVLSRCRDLAAVTRITKGADPIHRKLRKFRWFGQRDEVALDAHQSRGSIDPRRLHRIALSELIYRRWQQQPITDYRGHPVVVLAKDGSSSNTHQTIYSGQILTAAFLRIQKLAGLDVFAADYSSGAGGPLIRWMYHPQKTPAISPVQAVDAVASLPPKGQGGNEDVLSISHIIREALESIGPKQTVVVINITDGKFNSPVDQVREMIKELRADYRVTYSLVVLGNTAVSIPEANHTLHIPQSELVDPHRIAARIAKHVNAVVLALREKRKKRRV
jgi:hypothetical protein